jgi:hypothetical protein
VGNVKYTWRTEAPKKRKSERNKEERPEPSKQSKASSTSSSGSTDIGNITGKTKPERKWFEPAAEYQRGNLPTAQARPENSSPTQNQSAEVPEKATASNEERKEVTSSTPPSEQSQPVEAEETKEESMSPKTSPKQSQAADDSIGAFSENDPKGDTSVVSEHSSDEDIEMTVESEEHRQARIKKRNETATWKNMPKDSTPAQRTDWPKVWLGKFNQQQEQLEEEANVMANFAKRHMREDFDAALKLLCLPPWTNFHCVEFLQQLDASRKKKFKVLMSKYSTDKIARPDSDKYNPEGEDCSTPEKKEQAWKSRAQKFVEANETINHVAKWGVKELKTVNGKQVWI